MQSGPSFVVGSGTLIIASGPALCSPLKGVNLLGSFAGKPHVALSCGLLNQKPRWKVFVGASPASGSNPKISVEEDGLDTHVPIIRMLSDLDVRFIPGQTRNSP